jgi:hypothetical protein
MDMRKVIPQNFRAEADEPIENFLPLSDRDGKKWRKI